MDSVRGSKVSFLTVLVLVHHVFGVGFGSILRQIGIVWDWFGFVPARIWGNP